MVTVTFAFHLGIHKLFNLYLKNGEEESKLGFEIFSK